MPAYKLYNPLDKFASYSIHHILLACRTTESAKVFVDDNITVQRETLDAIERVKQLGDPVPIGEGNVAYLVIDTRRFSQFSVDKLEYEVFINGVEKAGSHGNLATNLDMVVTDSVGISFINFIQWLMNEKMQTNFDGMVFMHRMVFVGHNPDGSTETVQSVTIPMHLFNMELNLEALKGTYTMKFMPNMNFDVKAHHRWLNIHKASNYFTGDKSTNTLGEIIDSFETQLNRVSEEYYNTVHKAMVDAGRVTGDGQYGRKVTYQITIPADWRPMKVKGSSTGNATEINFKKMFEDQDAKKQADAQKQADEAEKQRLEAAQKAAKENGGVVKVAGTPLNTHVSVETDRQITEVLDFIFRQVPEIADLGAGKKDASSVTFYKHFVGITSNNQEICVHVDVVPFRVPNLLVNGTGGNKTDNNTSAPVAKDDDQFYQEVGKDRARRPRNYMEFDYIFTGKNKDVLAFDLKFQDLQWMLASQLNMGLGVGGVVENQPTGTKPVEDGTTKVQERAELVLTRPYDAILMPKQTDKELKNFSDYTSLLSKDDQLRAIKTSNDYMKNLSMYYAMAPITAMMTIRGNPDIMTKFNQNSLLDHPGSEPEPRAATSTTTSNTTSRPVADYGPHSNYRIEFERRILDQNYIDGTNEQQFNNNGGTFELVKTLGSANYATSPVFVTVNVNGPNVKDYPGQSIVEGDFARKLLTDNYYVVFRVKNKIEGNIFTQELELYSHNIFSAGATKAVIPTTGS